MQIDGWTLLLQAINLAVLLGLLRWLLYRPLLAVIEQRRQRVSDELAAAQAARSQAEQASQALAAQRAAIDTAREQALTEARQQAQAERQALIASARAAAQAEQSEARQRITTERLQASQALMGEASALAVDLARRLIQSSDVPACDGDVIHTLLDHFEATPSAVRQRWLDSSQPASVTLASANPPDADTVQRVKEQLQRALGTAVNLRLETRPKLLHGAELHFANGVLAQSWAAELAAAQAEMQQAQRTLP